MKTVMLAGAGSNGKTMLLEALEKLGESHAMKVCVYKSTTRKTYAAAGLKNEAEALADPKFNMEHQEHVFSDYVAALHGAAQTAVREGCDLFVTDRTPYDYASYYMSVFQSELTLDLITRKRGQALRAMNGLAGIVRDKIWIYHLPWPARWSQDTVSSDGWRADKTPKNFIWSALADSELGEARRGFIAKGTIPTFLEIGRLSIIAERGDPMHRAAAVLNEVLPNFGG